MTRDPRVKTIDIFNSGNFDFGKAQGLFDAFSTYMNPGMKPTVMANEYKIPTFFFLGGKSDVAFDNVSSCPSSSYSTTSLINDRVNEISRSSSQEYHHGLVIGNQLVMVALITR
jgi:hypothetical protein